MSLARKALFILIAILAVSIGLYPVMYGFVDSSFGLLSSKSEELLAATWWNAGFYTHITFGGLALLVGWTQFIPKLRTRRLGLHRALGKVYVTTVTLSGLAAIAIGTQATGGIISASGFIGLGIVWLTTTFLAFSHIRNKRIDAHQRMMVYSYAACFAAVTLRLWLPLLTNIYGEFIPAYRLVAWLCWVPNMGVAYWINKAMR